MKKNSKAPKDSIELIVNTPSGRRFRIVDSNGRPVRIYPELVWIGKLPVLPGAHS